MRPPTHCVGRTTPWPQRRSGSGRKQTTLPHRGRFAQTPVPTAPLSSAQSTPANDAGGTNDPNTAQRQAGRETIAGVAPAQAGKQVQPSPGYDFDPYDYSPDADLSAQVAGTVFNAGKADVNRWLQSQRPPVNTAPAPGDTRSRDERDAQDILGVGSTYTYTGDPEDVARQMWAESGVTNAAEFRDAEEYFGRSIVGGTLDTLRDTANDISRRSQLSIPEQQAENAYWGAVAGDRGEMDKVYREYLSSLSPDERDALEITGQLMSPEAVYYLHVNQREQEKHKNDRLVNAVDWGIRYNQETQRIAEEKGLSEKTLQEGSFYRSFGRSLPAAALSLTGGAGAGLVSAEAANLIIGASRVLSGSLTFHSAAGNAYEDAIQGGADPRSAMNYATAVGAVELFTESMVSGMGRLGGRALGLGAPGTQLAESFARRIAQDPVAREMILSTCNVLGEGVEEFLSELGGYFADRIFLKQDQRSFVQALRDAGDSVLPAMMTSTLFEFNTLLLEGLDARQAAALAPEMIVEDLLQRAGLEDADTDRSNDGQTGRQVEGSAQTRSWTDGPRGPIPEDSPSATYYDLQTLQTYDKMERASGGTGLLDRKPPYSPALRRWFRQGGTLEIRVENGHDIWTYTAPGGERCSYVDGNIRFSREHMYSDVGEINIGSFTTRAADRQKAIQILKADYAMKSVPSGYVLHHDSVNGVIQLVQKDIHSMFTHRGGFSIFVTNGGR